MKLACGRKARLRQEALERWHKFFAIFPRRVGYEDCRCFEMIERRRRWVSGTYAYAGYWTWDYRACQ